MKNKRGVEIRGDVTTPEHRKEFDEAGAKWAKERALSLILQSVPKLLYGDDDTRRIYAERGLRAAFELARQHSFVDELADAVRVMLSEAYSDSERAEAAGVRMLQKVEAEERKTEKQSTAKRI
jgi:hypothetical protein